MQDRLKMKDMPISERPYEKLEKFGSEMLSNSELLAIIIKTGNKKESSLDLANRILSCDDRSLGLSF
jgi:DNA repair protein RadC